MCFGLFEPFKGIQYNIWLQYGNLLCVVISTIIINIFFDESNIYTVFKILLLTNIACYYLVYRYKDFKFEEVNDKELLIKNGD